MPKALTTWARRGVTHVSPDLVSSVTDAVMTEVKAWQARPLEAMYPVVFFDALRVKIGEDAVVRSRGVHFALGVLPDCSKDTRVVGADSDGEPEAT